MASSTVPVPAGGEAVTGQVLGMDGFVAAFSLVFLSEIGDKTFFMAALLAMRLGKWVSFVASLAALVATTIISVGIGVAFKHVPGALQTSVPVGQICGVLLFAFFGIKCLRDAFKSGGYCGDVESGKDDENEELEEAKEEVLGVSNFIQVASIIFLAEWGDRSMLATIGLAASESMMGVTVGAIAGHFIATGIAVFCGVMASKYISETTVNFASGVLFLIFAAVTLYNIF